MQAIKEIKPLTGLRGLASLHVMTFHYFLGLSLTNPLSTFVAHGYLEVDLFFVLSGFVMAFNYASMFEAGWSTNQYARFLGRRIARVYPLYLATSIVGLLMTLAGSLSAPRLATPAVTFVLNLCMVQSWGLAESLNPPAWSISAEWAAYLAFPLLLVVCLFRSKAAAYVACAICIGALGILSRIPLSLGHQTRMNALMDLSDPRYALPVIRCLAEFSLGLIVFRVRSTTLGITVVKQRWMAAAVCIAWLALMATPGWDLGVVLLLPLIVLGLTSDKHPMSGILSSRPLELLGRLSYSIYLVHALMRGFIAWIHERVTSLGWHHTQTYAATCAAGITLLLSYVTYQIIEIPGRRLLRDAFEGSQPAVPAAESSAP